MHSASAITSIDSFSCHGGECRRGVTRAVAQEDHGLGPTVRDLLGFDLDTEKITISPLVGVDLDTEKRTISPPARNIRELQELLEE